MAEASFQTPQGRLFYRVSGQGRPLVLLHGNGEDHHIFDAALPRLAESFRVYAPDSRGHGQSFPTAEYHYLDMAEDMRLFIEGLGLEKPLVCGFSDGGILGLLLACRYPALLDGLVACGVNTCPGGLKPAWRLLFHLQYLLKRSPLDKLMLTEPNITPAQLAAVRCPVLVTGGSRDVISRRHLQAIVSRIPGAQLQLLPGESHSSYIMGSEKIAHIVETFAGSLG